MVLTTKKGEFVESIVEAEVEERPLLGFIIDKLVGLEVLTNPPVGCSSLKALLFFNFFLINK